MKTFLFISLAIFSAQLSAQKTKTEVEVEEDSGYALVNGVKSFRMEKIGCQLFNNDCHWDVYDMKGNKVLVITRAYYNDPAEITKSNTQGSVWYARLVFLDSAWTGEFRGGYVKTEKWAKYIVERGLFKNGELDPKAAREYVLVQGTPVSDYLKRRKY